MREDASHAYSAADRDAIYRVMAQRRDMRHFTPGAQVAPEVLERLLLATHAGPSV
ncbi:MAG: 5,6-dimethylbenzimidazole synthase, partial [Brachymonas denitrificans]